MKNLLFSLIFLATWSTLSAQTPAVQQADVEFPLRFLASDDLMGRRTGEMGNNMAARFIAEYFRTYGLKTVEGAEDYYQNIPFEGITPPSMASLTIGDQSFKQGEDLLIMTGNALDTEAKAVFAGHGWVDADKDQDDYKGLKVEGKVVIVLPGTPDASDPSTVFKAMGVKRQLAAERGAIGVIEMYRLPFPWGFFKNYFNKESLQISAGGDSPISYGFVNKLSDETFARLKKGKKVKVSLQNSDYAKREIPSQNVIGVLEGTDPELKKEYVLISAHYDHVGTGKNGGGAFTAQDSIFNGARDNGMGTVALLSAVKALSQNPPKRSIIFLAVTAEEIGLLGSAYYAENPLVPLNETIFNLNTDGAGYNDKTAVSVTGYGRTGTDEWSEQAAQAAGLTVIQNPVPEQNLYDRSDNVAFARKGIPAICFSPGVTSFDSELGKYYHQVADEADAIDFPYFTQYCQAFVTLAELIANDNKRPEWTAGDKYEEAGKMLYLKN